METLFKLGVFGRIPIGMLLLASIVVPAHPKEFTIIHSVVSEYTKRWDQTFAIIDGGYADGLAPGMTADVILITAADSTTKADTSRVAIIELAQVQAHESRCNVDVKAKVARAAAGLRAGVTVEIPIPERTSEQIKKIAAEAEKQEEWGLALHFWRAYVGERPDDPKGVEATTKCLENAEKDRLRPLTDGELRRAATEKPTRYALVIRYTLMRRYLQARDKLEEIFRAFPGDRNAQILLERVNILDSLPPDAIYSIENDPQWREVQLIPAWPQPGQPHLQEIRTRFKRSGRWAELRALVDAQGRALALESLGGDADAIPNAIAYLSLIQTSFSPCLRNGEPVTAWTKLVFGLPPATEQRLDQDQPRELYDTLGNVILIARLLNSGLNTSLLLVTDGGYLAGLHDGLTAGIQWRDSTGQPVIVATAKIIDVERYQAWCKAEAIPGTDPRLLDAACEPGRRVEFGWDEVSADSLQQLAVSAMGSADYKTGAALLSRLIALDSSRTSAHKALNQCFTKLAAIDDLPMDSSVLAFEKSQLPFYVEMMHVYSESGRLLEACDMALRILRVDQSSAEAKSVRLGSDRVYSNPVSDTGASRFKTLITPKHTVFRCQFDPNQLWVDFGNVESRAWFSVIKDPTGRVFEATLIQSCGHPTLDSMALGSMMKCRWFPPRTKGLSTGPSFDRCMCCVDFSHAAEGLTLVYELNFSEGDATSFIQMSEFGPYGNPILLHAPRPDYTAEADVFDTLSPVFLDVLVDTLGAVDSVICWMSSGTPFFDSAAIAAARGTRFAASVLDGKPERFWTGYVVLPIRKNHAETQSLGLDTSETLPVGFLEHGIGPEMIEEHQPIYPREAEQDNITGSVWINALVGENGKVVKAMIGKTSGHESLDEAALTAAWKCRYKPAIKDGRPVKLWVTYRVDFTID